MLWLVWLSYPYTAGPEGKTIGDITADYQTNNNIWRFGYAKHTKNGLEWWDASLTKWLPTIRINLMAVFWNFI